MAAAQETPAQDKDATTGANTVEVAADAKAPGAGEKAAGGAAVALLMSAKETENGYPLRDLRNDLAAWSCTPEMYATLKDLWAADAKHVKDGGGEKMDAEAFWTAFEALDWMPEWGANDPNGNILGGYWLLSRKDMQTDPGSLGVRRTNVDALFALPYPKPFLLHLVHKGVDCVRHINTMAVWFSRHLASLSSASSSASQ
jgi:hypothetical protein